MSLFLRCFLPFQSYPSSLSFPPLPDSVFTEHPQPLVSCFQCPSPHCPAYPSSGSSANLCFFLTLACVCATQCTFPVHTGSQSQVLLHASHPVCVSVSSPHISLFTQPVPVLPHAQNPHWIYFPILSTPFTYTTCSQSKFPCPAISKLFCLFIQS